MFIITGSTMMAATSPRCRSSVRSKTCRSLKGTTVTSSTTACGVPALYDTERGASAGPILSGGALGDRLDDQRVRMPHHHDTEAVMKVDVLVAVDVPDAAAFPVVDKDRLGRRILEG